MGQFVEGVFVAFQQFHEVGRRPRLEPVAAVPAFHESVEQAEGIVYPRAAGVEMIAVIILLQFGACLLISLSVILCQSPYVLVEVVEQFLLADAADGRVVLVH